MTWQTLLMTIFLSMAPISELRGAIPYGYFNGMSMWLVAPLAILCNAMVAPLCYLFLSSLHKLFYGHWNWYHRLFDKTVERAQTKIHAQMEKYGYWGIMLFVAVPLPVTGAWTGTLGAWILGLDKKKTMLAVCGGVIISGIIVTTIVLLGVGVNSLFVKTF